MFPVVKFYPKKQEAYIVYLHTNFETPKIHCLFFKQTNILFYLGFPDIKKHFFIMLWF